MLPQESIKLEINVPAKMRDGTVLYADVYRPDNEEKYPAVLIRTPYDKTFPMGTNYLNPRRVALAGYAVVVQDCRGTGASEGEFYAFRSEPEDGHDTVEWVAVQPWCDGNVGMYGLSYVGCTQWAATVTQPPHLKTICPAGTSADFRRPMCDGGVVGLWRALRWWRLLRVQVLGRSASALSKSKLGLEELKSLRERLFYMIDHEEEQYWFLPLKDVPIIKEMSEEIGLPPFYLDWLTHIDDDDYWEQFSAARYERITVPCFHLSGWNDHALSAVLAGYKEMKERGGSELSRKNQKLLVGPWIHGGEMSSLIGKLDTGAGSSGSAIDITGIHIRWFDYWLKGIDNGIMDEPPVRVFVMGDNIWREENEWPLARTKYTPYYFHSNGHANTRFGDGILSTKSPDEEEVDIYLYDPRNPVPTTGGVGGGGTMDANVFGVQDQQEVERRHDILAYTSPPLEADLEVTGPVVVKLWAASSAPDTDFTAKLVDVWPNGKAYNLTQGIVRARYRESVSEAKLIEPGKIYEYTLDLFATSNVFKAGHRIRVDISSSNFPWCDRNLNTGHPIGEDAEMQVAVQTIHHDKQHPSHIILPVIPRQ